MGIGDSYTKAEVNKKHTEYDTAIAARQTTERQEATYHKIGDSYTKAEVNKKHTEYDTAIAARQTTERQEATYRKIGDSYTKAEVNTRDGLRVLQTEYDTA